MLCMSFLRGRIEKVTYRKFRSEYGLILRCRNGAGPHWMGLGAESVKFYSSVSIFLKETMKIYI